MSKCLRCGSELPPTDECKVCAAGTSSADQKLSKKPETPSLMSKTIDMTGRQARKPESRIPTPSPHRIARPISNVADHPLPTARLPALPKPPPLPARQPLPTPVLSTKKPAPVPATKTPSPRPLLADFDHSAVPTVPAAPSPIAKVSDEQTAVTEVPDDVVEVHARPAALWRRICAWAVDLSLVNCVVMLYLSIASALKGIKTTGLAFGSIDAFVLRLHDWQPILAPGIALGFIVAAIYSSLFAFLWQGRTPGRFLVGIRLVDHCGLSPAPVRAAIRGLLSLISFSLCLSGFWMSLFDQRGQTLHDKLTSTYVVRPS